MNVVNGFLYHQLGEEKRVKCDEASNQFFVLSYLPQVSVIGLSHYFESSMIGTIIGWILCNRIEESKWRIYEKSFHIFATYQIYLCSKTSSNPFIHAGLSYIYLETSSVNFLHLTTQFLCRNKEVQRTWDKVFKSGLSKFCG